MAFCISYTIFRNITSTYHCPGLGSVSVLALPGSCLLGCAFRIQYAILDFSEALCPHLLLFSQ